jgi:hypothetical protein
MPGHWQSADGGPLCPIQLGAALIDQAKLYDGPFNADTRLDPVEAPLMLLPFLVRAARMRRKSLKIAWQDRCLDITPEGAVRGLDALIWSGPHSLAMMITPSSNMDAQTLSAKPTGLPALPVSTLKGLDVFALRTTVPATKASRSGAGSAATDND